MLPVCSVSSSDAWTARSCVRLFGQFCVGVMADFAVPKTFESADLEKWRSGRCCHSGIETDAHVLKDLLLDVGWSVGGG
jgi:hypothetical protein